MYLQGCSPSTVLLNDEQVSWLAAKALELLRWKPAEDEIGAYYWCARMQPNLQRCIEIGAPAVKRLPTWPSSMPVVMAGPDYHYKNVLDALVQIGKTDIAALIFAAQRGGNLVAMEVLGQMGDGRAVEPLI